MLQSCESLFCSACGFPLNHGLKKKEPKDSDSGGVPCDLGTDTARGLTHGQGDSSLLARVCSPRPTAAWVVKCACKPDRATHQHSKASLPNAPKDLSTFSFSESTFP